MWIIFLEPFRLSLFQTVKTAYASSSCSARLRVSPPLLWCSRSQGTSMCRSNSGQKLLAATRVHLLSLSGRKESWTVMYELTPTLPKWLNRSSCWDTSLKQEIHYDKVHTLRQHLSICTVLKSSHSFCVIQWSFKFPAAKIFISSLKVYAELKVISFIKF